MNLKRIVDISRFSRITSRVLIILMLILLSAACAPAKKNPWYKKRVKASRENTQQLGRNRYYFSDNYQKKLVKSYKKNKARVLKNRW